MYPIQTAQHHNIYTLSIDFIYSIYLITKQLAYILFVGIMLELCWNMLNCKKPFQHPPQHLGG